MLYLVVSFIVVLPEPTGGHWILVVGYDSKGWIVHDPFGQLDHIRGNYYVNDGEYLHYSYNLMDSRWTVDSSSDGWCILVDAAKYQEPEPEVVPIRKPLTLEQFKTSSSTITLKNTRMRY